MISTSTETGKGIPGNFYLSAIGSGTGQAAYRLDGNTNTDFYFQLNQEFPFPDALQEFSIQTSNFSSQYGNNAGAVVNAVTKSGRTRFTPARSNSLATGNSTPAILSRLHQIS